MTACSTLFLPSGFKLNEYCKAEKKANALIPNKNQNHELPKNVKGYVKVFLDAPVLYSHFWNLNPVFL